MTMQVDPDSIFIEINEDDYAFRIFLNQQKYKTRFDITIDQREQLEHELYPHITVHSYSVYDKFCSIYVKKEMRESDARFLATTMNLDDRLYLKELFQYISKC